MKKAKRHIFLFPQSSINKPSSYGRIYLIYKYFKNRPDFIIHLVNHDLAIKNKIKLLENAPAKSIIIIQKYKNEFHKSKYLKTFKDKHVLVYDIDDYIDMNKNWPLIKLADHVLAGSHFLYEKIKKDNLKVYFLPIANDEKIYRYHYHPKPKRFTICWSECFADAYYRDLLMIAPALLKLKNKYNINLVLQGWHKEDINEKNMKSKLIKQKLPFAKLLFYLPLHKFNKEQLPILSKCHIAVVPFLNIASRKAKAGLNLRNFMLMGIPTVSSPVGEHNYIVKNNSNGLLAGNAQELFCAIEKLINDNQFYQRISKQANIDIQKKYCSKSIETKLYKIIKGL